MFQPMFILPLERSGPGFRPRLSYTRAFPLLFPQLGQGNFHISILCGLQNYAPLRLVCMTQNTHLFNPGISLACAQNHWGIRLKVNYKKIY